MNIKPGNQTTEYWFAVISQFVVICLVVAKVVAPEKEGEIDTAGKQIVGFLTLLLPVIIPLVYSAHRTDLKKAATESVYQIYGTNPLLEDDADVDLTGDYAFEGVLEQMITGLREDGYAGEKTTDSDPGDVQTVEHDNERERPV